MSTDEQKFVRTPGSRVCLFDLPCDVRRKILVPEPPGIHQGIINHWRDGCRTCWNQQGRVKLQCCPKEWTEQQLLFVSRAVSQEYLSAVISMYAWKIDRRDIGGLSQIMSFGLTAWSAFRSLTVCLNGCSLHSSIPCPCGNEVMDSPSHREDKVSPILSEWTYICEQLACHIKAPNTLTLNVIGDVSQVETARAIVAPMMNLPILRDCTIGICQQSRRNRHQIRNLVEQATLNLTKKPTSATPFRFMSLPCEIQMQILELSISQHTLKWQPRDKAFERRCCGHCTPFGNVRYGATSEFRNRCCCSSFLKPVASSTTCQCWYWPGKIFLVSHGMYELAAFVFFSKTRFSFPSAPSGRSPDVKILRGLSQDTLNRVRFIELEFHWYPPDRVFLPDSKGYDSWAETLGFIAQHMNLQCLNLELCFLTGDGPKQKPELRSSSQRIVEPMTDKLKGLQNFFVHINSDSESFQRKRKRGDLAGLGDMADEEAVLERQVMGENYDSQARGKANWFLHRAGR